MYSDDDLIPISGLQHVIFCDRQFALIHLEQAWEDNQYTAEGDALHERVDNVRHESRRLFRQEYGMSVRSLELGIIGKCDLVEFYLEPGGGIAESNPVEFKRGRVKENNCDRVQLCAQALCIEEMVGVSITSGDLYYLGTHRRVSVELGPELRGITLQAIKKARVIINSGMTPGAIYIPSKCDRCSLIDICMPQSVGENGKRVDRYIEASLLLMRRECNS